MTDHDFDKLLDDAADALERVLPEGVSFALVLVDPASEQASSASNMDDADTVLWLESAASGYGDEAAFREPGKVEVVGDAN